VLNRAIRGCGRPEHDIEPDCPETTTARAPFWDKEGAAARKSAVVRGLMDMAILIYYGVV
jgi:hypothetical protein